MIKLEQKISGRFRMMDRAERHLTVRSHIATARKQVRRPLQVLAPLVGRGAARRSCPPMSSSP